MLQDMLAKIREAIPVVERGIPVIIMNAGEPNNILKMLRGEEVIGTLLKSKVNIPML